MKRGSLRGPLPLYARYCTAFIVAQLMLLTAGSLLWERFMDDTPVSTLHYRVQGSHALLAERLLQASEEDRPAVLQKLQSVFAYPLQLQPMETVAATLPSDEAEQLRQGQIVVSHDGDYSHQRLSGSASVLTLGSFIDLPSDPSAHPLEDELYWISLLTTLVAAIALPLYFLIHRLWHDVWVLHDTVQDLRANDFSHPIPALRTRLLRPLGGALCDLSQQLRVLLDGQRLMGQAMAHELRTPLARLRFTTGLMEEQQPPLPSEHAVLLRELQTDLQLLQELAAASVEYMRFGRMPLVERNHVRVAPLLEAAASHISRREGPSLSIECAPGLQVEANGAALELAARNLMGNAVRYGKRRVCVRATCQDHGLRLQVDDDGPGISPAHREHVFAPYVRLHDTPGGFGLGLAMVKTVAERHNGHVHIGDSELGGAAVVLWLPAASMG